MRTRRHSRRAAPAFSSLGNVDDVNDAVGVLKDPGENVLLVEPRDPAALAQAIGTLMQDDDLRHHLRDGVTKLAHEWLSWDEAIPRTVALLNPRP